MIKITLTGNVSSEPEMRQPTSASVCVFNVAVNNKDKTTFFRINAWRGLGEVCKKYVSKGMKVAVVGDLSAYTYETKQGKTLLALDVTADEVEFLSPAKKTDDFSDVSADDLPF